MALFSRYDTKDASNKSENKKVRLHQTKKLQHTKGINQQNEKATYRTGENFVNHIYENFVNRILVTIQKKKKKKEITQLNNKKNANNPV